MLTALVAPVLRAVFRFRPQRSEDGTGIQRVAIDRGVTTVDT